MGYSDGPIAAAPQLSIAVRTGNGNVHPAEQEPPGCGPWKNTFLAAQHFGLHSPHTWCSAQNRAIWSRIVNTVTLRRIANSFLWTSAHYIVNMSVDLCTMLMLLLQLFNQRRCISLKVVGGDMRKNAENIRQIRPNVVYVAEYEEWILKLVTRT